MSYFVSSDLFILIQKFFTAILGKILKYRPPPPPPPQKKKKKNQQKKHRQYSSGVVVPVNAHVKVKILNLNYINSFIFYYSTNRLSNDVHYN